MTTVMLLANLLAMPIAAAADIKCENLNPDDKGNSAVKENVVTISEEEIGGAKEGNEIGETGQGMKVIYCFRETKCSDKKCNSVYKGECTPDADTTCQRVQVLYAPTGSALLYGYIGLIYRYAATTIGIVAVLYLVYGGILITTAGDNSGQIDKAKEKIFQSIAGLVLLFLSGVILYTINPNFFTL